MKPLTDTKKVLADLRAHERLLVSQLADIRSKIRMLTSLAKKAGLL